MAAGRVYQDRDHDGATNAYRSCRIAAQVYADQVAPNGAVRLKRVDNALGDHGYAYRGVPGPTGRGWRCGQADCEGELVLPTVYPESWPGGLY